MPFGSNLIGLALSAEIIALVAVLYFVAKAKKEHINKWFRWAGYVLLICGFLMLACTMMAGLRGMVHHARYHKEIWKMEHNMMMGKGMGMHRGMGMMRGMEDCCCCCGGMRGECPEEMMRGGKGDKECCDKMKDGECKGMEKDSMKK